MMKKISLDEVMNDDPNSQFWQHMSNNPQFKKFEHDLKYILDQSHKHGKSYNNIDPSKLDPYDWKLK